MIKIINRLKYKFIFFILKYLANEMYNINKDYKNNKLGLHPSKNHLIPRPSIIFAKKRFKNLEVKCLEIGVKEGINSESILNELNIKKLYLIDIWNNYNEFELVKKKFKNNSKINIIKGNSQTNYNYFYNYYFDIIYIDGNHEYDYVYNDLKNYFIKVRNNGLICGHDFHLESVKKAVFDFCKKYNQTYYNLKYDFLIIKNEEIF